MKLADKEKDEFTGNGIVEFCKKHIRYILAGVLGVVLIAVLMITTGKQNTEDKVSDKDGTKEVVQEVEAAPEEFKINEIPEINTLFENYYAAYAAGDISALETYASPISDTEKSYITVMSEHISSYQDITCYTKSGLEEGDFAVTVVMNMCFEGVETAAPGLEFFYVRKDQVGGYYIDNLYSQFNAQNSEMPTNPQIEEFIADYVVQEDIGKLCEEVETRYNTAISSDENLRNMAETVVQDAITVWALSLAEEGTENQDASQEEPVQEEAVQEETPSEDTAETETPESEQPEVTTETVYAVDNINIRKEPDEAAEKVGSAIAGQTIERVNTLDGGWSEIRYDGQKAYVKSEFLSIEQPEITEVAEETEEEEVEINYVVDGTKLVLNDAMNIRLGMSEDSERVGTAQVGDTVEVVLSYAEGWTKVKWNGETGYIRTDLLLAN